MTTRQMTYLLTVLEALVPLAFAGISAWAFYLGDNLIGFVLAAAALVLAIRAARDIRRAWRRQWAHEATLRRWAEGGAP